LVGPNPATAQHLTNAFAWSKAMRSLNFQPCQQQAGKDEPFQKAMQQEELFPWCLQVKNPGDTFTRCGMGIPQGLLIAATLSHERHVNAVYF
jgi:hypothetical protein